MDLNLMAQVKEFYEATVLEAIRNNQEVKKLLISKLHGIKYEDVTDEMRSNFKIENLFGEFKRLK